MNKRYVVMDDRDFWATLEFDLSAKLSQSSDKERRKYWIDGFIPERITDTKYGVNIEGEVWVAEGQKNQTIFNFLVKIPQMMLHRKIRDFEYEIVCFETWEKYLELNINKV